MNEVNMMGRIAKEIDLRYLNDGKPLAMFTLAVQRSYKNKSTGEYDADFIRCKAFGKTAELLSNYLEKGNRVIINGNLQTGSYEKDGVTHFTTDVMVQRFTFIDSKDKDQMNKKADDYKAKPTQSNEKPDYSNDDYDGGLNISDDDLPF